MSKSCEQCVDNSEQASEQNQSINILNNTYGIPVVSLVLLILGLAFSFFELSFFSPIIAFIWLGITYIIIGAPVLLKSAKLIAKGKIYNEFVLMSVATIGAFIIGSYAEGVAVMLFYVVGELFQDLAVKNAKKSIESLLKIQEEEATVLENDTTITMHPKKVKIGQVILVKPGQNVPLDGELVSLEANFNTAALTGESTPEYKQKAEVVYAGSVSLEKPVKIKVNRDFEDTKLSKIFKMVQDAAGRKAKTQLLINRLAKVYTPIVFWMAIAVVVLPFFFLGSDYVFQTWFQRALIFLVKGIFEVQEVHADGVEKELLLELIALLEANSTHPIAKAIVSYTNIKNSTLKTTNVEEISGHGLVGKVGEYNVLAGNSKLLDKYNIAYNSDLHSKGQTLILIAINHIYAGYIAVADALKDDALEAVKRLSSLKIKETIILSGDKQEVVDTIAKELGIQKAIGGLLPEEKRLEVDKLKKEGRIVAFVGDGINDAPVITLADVGIAMGGLGSDAAVETAELSYRPINLLR